MSNSNQEWTWSIEHKDWYRQEYLNGQWDTTWAAGTSGNTVSRDHRVDSIISPTGLAPSNQLPIASPDASSSTSAHATAREAYTNGEHQDASTYATSPQSPVEASQNPEHTPTPSYSQISSYRQSPSCAQTPSYSQAISYRQRPSYGQSTSYGQAQATGASSGLPSVPPSFSHYNHHGVPVAAPMTLPQTPSAMSYGAHSWGDPPRPQPTQLYNNAPGYGPVATSHLQVSNRRRGLARGRGQRVEGTYFPESSNPGTKFETLEPSFRVRSKNFFQVGKVFAVLFTENAGSTAVIDYNSNISTVTTNPAFSTVRFGEKVHTQVRRFIVVRPNREFCYACPIFTYGGQGTKKPGVYPDEHAIVYSYGNKAELLPNEVQSNKSPICVYSATGTERLDRASRIYFGIHHPIQYNVKVKDLGDVAPTHVAYLRGYWTMVNPETTSQAPEVTAAATQNAGGDDTKGGTDDASNDDEPPKISYRY